MAKRPANPITQETLIPITREIDLPLASRKVARRSVRGAALGNALEWFDYGVYGYLTLYIGVLFFEPFSDDPGTQRLFALAGFAVSFLLRPLGGMILGPLGDRYGRKRILVVTILMITLATACIGILPTAAAVGVWAPILLFLLRIVQGFSAGGEYAGAAVFMAESSPDDRRGFYGSFLEFGTLVGFTAAAVVCTVLTLIVGEQGMFDFWWRVPFLLCLPLGLFALWMRRSLEEPEAFTELESQGKTESPVRALVDLMRHYPRQLAKLFGFVIMLNVAYYIVMTYMPTYLSDSLQQSETTSGLTLIGIQIVMMVIIAPLGALSDRIGRRPILISAAVGFAVLSVPAFMLMQLGNPVLQIIGLAVLGLLLTALLAITSATIPALFPTNVRYSGFGLGYNIPTAIFGGTAGLVSQWLIQQTGNPLMPGIYLAVASTIGLVAVLTFNETAGRTLRGTHIPGEDDEFREAAGERLIGRVTRTGAINVIPSGPKS